MLDLPSMRDDVHGSETGDDIDLAAIRAKLASADAPTFWKSLEEVADTPAFKRLVAREYPAAAHLAKGPDRRSFFKVMAASFAMAGLAACGDDEDGRVNEVPYVRQPERIEPGKPLVYASSALVDGFANGILVTTVNGRPIKIEGNPRHPWSRGGTDIFAQASVLSLYDPSRSQTVRYLDRISDWDTFHNEMLGQADAWRAAKGKGLRILSGPTTSPSLIAQLRGLLAAMPEARWHMVSPNGTPDTAATQAVLGRPMDVHWHFDKARTVVAIEADLLDAGPRQVGVSRRYIEARQASQPGKLLTLHAAASTPSLTSAKADYHVAVEPDALVELVDRLGAEVGTPTGGSRDGVAPWVARAANALRDAKGESLVVAGPYASRAVQEAVLRLNATLGNVGKTLTFTDPVLPQADPLDGLVRAMDAGAVETLLMLDCNPVYEAPGRLGFQSALDKVKLRIHAGAYVDETAVRSDWHLPLAHPLEAWGDARAADGTASLMQPTIRPLYEGRTSSEIVSLLFEKDARSGQTIVQDFWRGAKDASSFEPSWHQALLDGFWANSAAPGRGATVKPANAPAATPAPPPRGDEVSLVFRPDPTIRESRHAANGWLQELPKPLTKLTWGNVACISPRLAETLKAITGDVVKISVGKAWIEIPVWVLPGQAARTVTMTLGYGRNQRDTIFDKLGVDVNALRLQETAWLTKGATIAKLGRKAGIATTQTLATMEGHDLVRISRDGDAPQRQHEAKRSSLYDDPSRVADAGPSHDTRAWGMVIDLDACIGCNACVVACQAENNIAVVGKEEVEAGRYMHWLRVDRYYSSAKTSGQGLDEPDTHFQPVPCMHCELAPCEVGCPVEATLHDHEGLNLMVYNRCVGTRACSGYCPYKVRRFNFLDYTAGQSPSIQARNNPDVTVRSRGVMEKCTYCVQRIAEARIDADKGDGSIPDGAVTTACQGACPTRAITFGNLADEQAAVAAKRKDPRNYDLLGELNVRPRTTYLAERAPSQTKEG